VIDIHPTAHIDVEDLVIGDGTVIRAHAEIYGRRVHLGRECFVDEYAVIGGGSADQGELMAGDWLHCGMYSQINTARAVHVGHEVGVGIGSRIFTHGAYLSEWDGFPASFAPVTIGDRVWLPNAVVLPGVTIGSDVVVAAGSCVSRDLPSGALAAGTPATVKRAHVYPKKNSPAARHEILRRIAAEAGLAAKVYVESRMIAVAEAVFSLVDWSVAGPVSSDAERLRQQLRRHGIRFRYSPVDGVYQAWK
jgi:acetyltransferase-like isoleucine patch superfamily enzyme